MRYFVYEYWNPLKNEPFYVGKGTDNRHLDHLREAKQYTSGQSGINLVKIKTILKIWKENLDPIIKIVFKTNNEDDAYDTEENLIKLYGRLNIRTGPLANLNDGGRRGGNSKSNRSGKNYEEIYGEEKSKEIRKLLSEIGKTKEPWNKGKSGYKKSKIHSNKNKSYDELYGEEQAIIERSKRSLALKGKSHEEIYGVEESKILREEASKRQKGQHSINKGKTLEEIVGIERAQELKELNRKNKSLFWKVIDPNDNKFIIQSLRHFCELENLSYSKMLYIAEKRKTSSSYRGKDGWICEYTKEQI